MCATRRRYGKGDRRSVPRADVAEVVVRCLDAPEARNLSFDLASRQGGGEGGHRQIDRRLTHKGPRSVLFTQHDTFFAAQLKAFD